MCGIAGFSGQWSTAEARTRITAMTDRIAHRGPDAGGCWMEPGITLGHRRLSIIDLSEAANQPLIDHSGRYVLIFNGEIYNYRELRKELGRRVSDSVGDTDVVLAAYMSWGPACVERFNGMFALAIWDKEDKSLFVARDRLGIKPFYYTRQGGEFQFASELRSLLAGGWCAKKLDDAGLVDYLAYGTVQGPRTMLAEVQSLPPGAWGMWQYGELKTETYWALPTAIRDGDTDPATVRNRVADLLGQAVARRMVSDVPLGAFLSGGID
ncbi:MAG: asparagine synthase (glutamine-hydrolyzing), partial [Bacteroidota bacterium]